MLNLMLFTPQMSITFVISTSNNHIIDKMYAWERWRTSACYLPSTFPDRAVSWISSIGVESHNVKKSKWKSKCMHERGGVSQLDIYPLFFPDRAVSWTGMCSTQILGLTRLWLTWQSRWFNSDSTQYYLHFSWLTQLWDNSNHKFANLTQLWLNSFESDLRQIWLTTYHILHCLAESCWPGGGVRSTVAVGWFFPCYTITQYKLLTFSHHKN